MSEEVSVFLSKIDDYIACRGLEPLKIRPESKEAEAFTMDDIEKLTQDECFNHAFMLYQYCSCISTERAKQNIALNWCNGALNTIVARESGNFSQYTKHEMKIAHVINENHVAKKIDEWRAIAEARVLMLDNREYILKRQAECLMEKGKRK